jgi:hypothetical protein
MGGLSEGHWKIDSGCGGTGRAAEPHVYTIAQRRTSVKSGDELLCACMGHAEEIPALEPADYPVARHSTGCHHEDGDQG